MVAGRQVNAIFLKNSAPQKTYIYIWIYCFSYVHTNSFSIDQKLGIGVSIMHATFQGSNSKNKKDVSEIPKITRDFRIS